MTKNKHFENQILQAINLTSLWVAKNDNLLNKFYRKAPYKTIAASRIFAISTI